MNGDSVLFIPNRSNLGSSMVFDDFHPIGFCVIATVTWSSNYLDLNLKNAIRKAITISKTVLIYLYNFQDFNLKWLLHPICN